MHETHYLLKQLSGRSIINFISYYVELFLQVLLQNIILFFFFLFPKVLVYELILIDCLPLYDLE